MAAPDLKCPLCGGPCKKNEFYFFEVGATSRKWTYVVLNGRVLPRIGGAEVLRALWLRRGRPVPISTISLSENSVAVTRTRLNQVLEMYGAPYRIVLKKDIIILETLPQ